VAGSIILTPRFTSGSCSIKDGTAPPTPAGELCAVAAGQQTRGSRQPGNSTLL
jgi:hypothetical protein